MLVFLFQHLVVRWIDWIILPSQICANLILIFAWSFTQRLTYTTLNLLGRSQMDPGCTLFLGNNRQHMSVYATLISSWVRKVLCVTKVHMSPGTLCGAAVLVAGVSLVSTLQEGDWTKVSTTARYYFSMCITTTDFHQDSI